MAQLFYLDENWFDCLNQLKISGLVKKACPWLYFKVF